VWQATAADSEAVCGLLLAFRDHWGRSWPAAESFRRSVTTLLADPNTEFLLGSEGAAQPDGVCQLRFRHGVWWAGEDCWLEDLYVRESARGTGLGRALAQAALDRARERGCARVQLDVAEGNAAARALYESLGFGSSTLMLTLPLRAPAE